MQDLENFEVYYQAKVKEIEQLKCQLLNKPDDRLLQFELKNAEDELYEQVVKSSRELEQFLKLYEPDQDSIED